LLKSNNPITIDRLRFFAYTIDDLKYHMQGGTVIMRLPSRLVILAVVIVGLFFVLGTGAVLGAGNVLLKAINGSSAHGIAELYLDSSGKNINLQLQFDGLLSNTSYEVSLDQQQCGGSLLLEVGMITSDANGHVAAIFSLAPLGNALQRPVWLDIHQGTTISAPSIACGQVQVNSASYPISHRTPSRTDTH
jgi:hypothetical protein